jgi:riboflavin synthase
LAGFFRLVSTNKELAVFTGIIQTVGTINAIGSDRLEISWEAVHAPAAIAEDLAIGDSIAVDGVCLTVEKILPSGFIASVSPETLRRSTLGNASGQPVNLESALRVGSKLGGHFVSGHVDGMGGLETVVETATAWEIVFGPAPDHIQTWQKHIAPYIVSKGSIAINGISLTISDCDDGGNWFRVAVIPHTYHHTNLCHLRPGSLVNLETDLLGKYAEKLLRQHVQPNSTSPHTAAREDLTPEFLAENGYC